MHHTLVCKHTHSLRAYAHNINMLRSHFGWSMHSCWCVRMCLTMLHLLLRGMVWGIAAGWCMLCHGSRYKLCMLCGLFFFLQSKRPVSASEVPAVTFGSIRSFLSYCKTPSMRRADHPLHIYISTYFTHLARADLRCKTLFLKFWKAK